MTALFKRLGPTVYRATDMTRGPWDPTAQHGGPPSALIAGAIEATPGNGGAVARITVEILGPVPISELELTTEVLRPGRRIEMVGATLRTATRTVATATAWRFATDAVELSAMPDPKPTVPPPSSLAPDPSHGAGRFADEAVERRFAAGGWDAPGPATAWLRLGVPVVEGEPISPLQRAVAAADFTNGVSSVLPLDSYLFINTDLTVNLYRSPDGEWIGMAAESHLGSDGRGLAGAILFDESGSVGRSSQTLLVGPR